MSSFFYDMIAFLFKTGEVALCDKELTITEEDEMKVLKLLELTYQKEATNYPYTAPQFDDDTALWAAKMVYKVSQLLLFRDLEIDKIEEIIYLITKPLTPSSVLSADICLRFLPALMEKYREIDPSDEVIPILNNILMRFQYSDIGRGTNMNDITQSLLKDNKCLNQLFTDRIIKKADIGMALQSGLKENIQASLGMYQKELWPAFYIRIKTDG